MTSHPIFARLYARLAPVAEKAGAAAHRDELLASLEGRVIELGPGSGLCFVHYPSTVSKVVAVEPEPHLRRVAEQAAAAAPVPVRVIGGTAERLPADDGSFDAAVVSLVLCSVADQRRALGELHRVLRPGGSLRFYEHVRSENPRQARLQDRIDWVWPHLAGGCHANRDTDAAIAESGFHVERCRRFEFRPSILAAPFSPHVIGEAIRR
jgi:ubiquinone/menaquinone biosynthesis C-methylase UbiE